MKMHALRLLILLLLPYFVLAQEKDSLGVEKVIEKLKYKQQPGLALAASKIFFSDKRYSISGFGEVAYVHYQGGKNTEAGDLELYYTNLYRYATFFGYRLTDKIIWNSEFQIEYLHDGFSEGHYEIVIEAFFDFLLNPHFNARIGYYPLPIGYVNSNDEPPMFYSVNRSEVERLITPTTWIEFGAMFYGTIYEDLSYALGISQGITAANYLSGTWIRQGRELRFGLPRSIAFNPQLNYSGLEGLTISASGYFGNSGQGNTVEVDEEELSVTAPVQLYSAYLKYDWRNFRLVTVGTLGYLGESDRVYSLTEQERGLGQVMGEKTYGYLAELGVDILPWFRGKGSEGGTKRWWLDPHEMKIPIFLRYERLDTHNLINQEFVQGLNPLLLTQGLVHNDLRIWTLGANFKPKENIVLKANYQFRKNFAETTFDEGDRLEFGFGFIF